MLIINSREQLGLGCEQKCIPKGILDLRVKSLGR